MSRRTRIRRVVFLTAAFALLFGFACQGRLRAQAYRRALSNSYRHAFAELTAQLSGMDAALQKGRYATSPAMVSALCAEVYSRAAAAQMALGELPLSDEVPEQTAAFLAKTGDYAWSLAKAALADGVTEEARATLAALAEVSADLSQRVYALQEELNSEDFSAEALLRAEKALTSGESGRIPADSLFQAVEQEFPELPTLIYDGPFSEHLTAAEPKYLAGKGEVDAPTARRAAAAFLDLPEERLELISVGQSTLPTYGFSVTEEDRTLYLEVTRRGGVVTELLTDRQVGPARLLPASALAIAGDFLLEHGYADMAETYHIRQGGLLTVNYAYAQGAVLCYPDLVKVTVSLDTGEVTAFEAEGYLMNHTPRDLPAPSLPAEEARALLSPALTVLSHRTALIPTAGQYEVLCREFTCRGEDGRHVLVYLNAETGREEKILILLEDENGTLVR